MDNLPPEVVIHIFIVISDISDLLSLSSTNKYIREIFISSRLLKRSFTDRNDYTVCYSIFAEHLEYNGIRILHGINIIRSGMERYRVHYYSCGKLVDKYPSSKNTFTKTYERTRINKQIITIDIVDGKLSLFTEKTVNINNDIGIAYYIYFNNNKCIYRLTYTWLSRCLFVSIHKRLRYYKYDVIRDFSNKCSIRYTDIESFINQTPIDECMLKLGSEYIHVRLDSQ